MSTHILPRWQRSLIRWHLQRLMRKKDRHSRLRPSRPCPSCQAPFPAPTHLTDDLWDMLVRCPHCGHATSLMDLAMDGEKTPEERLAEGGPGPQLLPSSSRITVQDTGSERVWTLPAKGGANFLLVFGGIWFAFTTIIGLSSLGASWPASLFIFVFPLIGVGLIYAGLRMSYTQHVLTLNVVELTHDRRFFGRNKRRTLPREDIESVQLVVFYSENYKPVHGLEIKAGRRKIRFGSSLTPDEKAWLCSSLREALGSELAAVNDADTSASPVPAAGRMEIEENPHGCIIRITPGKFGMGLMLAGLGMAGVATFMIVMASSSMWMGLHDGPPLPFWLVWNGFLLFWCGGVACFGLLGLAAAMAGWRMKHTHHQITASKDAVQVLETCRGKTYETLLEAATVQDVRIGSLYTLTPPSNGDTPRKSYHRGLLLLQDRVMGFGAGCSLHELQPATEALNRALGRN